MHAPDLEPVQQLVNSARQRYLEALASYEPDGRRDAEQVINEFVVKWQNEPGRSAIVMRESNEAIDLIRDFQGVEARVTTKVVLTNMQMEQTILHFGIELFEASIKGIGLPCRDDFMEQ